jgi:hypothetical protein
VSVLIEKFPESFKPPHDVVKYDRKLNPTLCLKDYEMGMIIQNASDMIMTRYLPLMMKDAVRNWIQGLHADNVNSWYEMRRVFIRNFKGTYKRPATDKDIENCVHRKNESTRKYLACWAELVNSLVDVPKDVACREFIRNCRYRELQDELMRANPRQVSDLVKIASQYARSDCIKDDSDNEDHGKYQLDAPKNKKHKHDD